MNAKREAWADIPGIPGYQASTLGRIRSPNGILQLVDDGRGYWQCSPSIEGKAKTRKVHSLVALAFLGPRPKGQEVRHLNGVRHDCRVLNLTYGTSRQNHLDNRRGYCHKGKHRATESNTYTHPVTGNRRCNDCRTERRRGARV